MTIAEQQQSPSAIAQLALYLSRKGRRVWPLTVAAKRALTPHMTRVTFSVPKLDELAWKRGQDLVLEIPAGAEIVRRHYTIRDIDVAAGTLAIDFVQHGASPAGRWVAGAVNGTTLNGAGPRGHTYLRDADWHLFVGDETAMPGILAMLEGLPRTAAAHVFLEIGGDGDRQAAPVPIHWISRDGKAPGPSRLLYDAVEAFALPPGRGFAYILGETSSVRAIRQRLIARGLGKEQTCAEGYWRPGRVGGHDHA